MMTEKEIEQFLSELQDTPGRGEAAVRKVRFSPLDSLARPGSAIKTGLAHIEDVKVTISAELGEKTMKFREVLNLDVGSVIDLEKSAGDAINVYINEEKTALGEIIVVNDNFAVRINKILPPKRLGERVNHGQ
ncbi:FliM/FliN family flagellar motor switch protein [Desulforamulus hydrothermalis]|uniref:Flagellar motor switch protein FliN n=1 Tax=Desulforamulus hydrothermalis Lam5 = DSM 18033 TaxID=1121428 RepID=K8E0N3_9FIRM|nr:FliM/FliN family flagellar motor switch protein [Desulforamulus hydrothermalis]CCO09174.1 Flagellar motor switch protein FliN [Desulforamulus hydrothermalis Lam5 = DSM 18033]SHH11284.1 flagellar motor switch protein FliN/FliY [Desulforamulus hydrothermalis Lam5 = DSM 18033]